MAGELTVVIPAAYEAERRYIVQVLLGEFLGLEFQCVVDSALTDETVIRVGEHARLVVADGLFSLPSDAWLTERALPRPPVVAAPVDPNQILAAAGTETLPVIAWADPGLQPLYRIEAGEARLSLDVFGVSFYLLTRYEELVSTASDSHGRFPAQASYLVRHGLLQRPIVNEYLEVLWALLQAVAPQLSRREREFRQLISHDVDIPFEVAFASPKQVVRAAAGDLVKRRAVRGAAERLRSWSAVRGGNWQADRCNNFDWIMSECERRGIRSAFYFIAGRTNARFDAAYDIGHPAIRSIVRSVAARGHEVGLHPSYETWTDPIALAAEFSALRRIAADEGVEQLTWGGRQHFLRWKAQETWQHWDNAGLDYDSSLGYAQEVGFRCGSCYEFPVFDLLNRRPLRLRERPLVVMDVSLVAKEYMALRFEDASEQIAQLKVKCRRYCGDFVFLWHNHNLLDEQMRSLFLGGLDA